MTHHRCNITMFAMAQVAEMSCANALQLNKIVIFEVELCDLEDIFEWLFNRSPTKQKSIFERFGLRILLPLPLLQNKEVFTVETRVGEKHCDYMHY